MNTTLVLNKNDSHHQLQSIRLIFLTALMLLMYLMMPLAHADRNKSNIQDHFSFGKRVIEVDIVENPRKFSFDETPTFEDGSANAYGAEFVTQGFIYPKGTLEMGNGVDAEGNPQFPDLVIGTWFCRGWHVGDGARTTTGPML